MFNEYTAPGDTIMIYGDFFNLYEIDSLNAVVDFNGKVSPVIKSANKYPNESNRYDDSPQLQTL